MSSKRHTRRRLLRTAGAAGIFGLAGCAGGDDDESATTSEPTSTATPTAEPTPARTDTPTDTPTETAADTPTPTPQPELRTVNPITTEASERSDVTENRTSAFGKGGFVYIGAVLVVQIHDAEVDTLIEATVRDSAGEIIEEESQRVKTEEADEVGASEVGAWFRFDAREWEKGTYTAEVRARDVIVGTETGTVETEFEITDPLDESEVRLVSTPDSVRIGEDVFGGEVVIENVSERDGSVVTSVSSSGDGGDTFVVSLERATHNFTANSKGAPDFDLTAENSGEFVIRLDDYDLEFELTIEPS